MEKNVELSNIYDIYGAMLTEKQQELFELYYVSDLSLREIAQNKGISYQAVRDSIKSSELMLISFEKKVGMYKLKNDLKNMYDKCSNLSNEEDIKSCVIKTLKDII